MIDEAISALRAGKIVFIYDSDSRESETDMVVASIFIKPEHIMIMRKYGGGLICTALTGEDMELLGLPFMADILKDAATSYPALRTLNPYDIPYDEKSSFSITINHRKTFTGITDKDRALTILHLAKLIKSGRYEDLGREFRSPGHVHLLRAADDLIYERQGHTEISLALCKLAGIVPVATICEIMDDSGDAMSKEDARDFALHHNYVFVSSDEIIDAYERKFPQRK